MRGKTKTLSLLILLALCLSLLPISALAEEEPHEAVEEPEPVFEEIVPDEPAKDANEQTAEGPASEPEQTPEAAAEEASETIDAADETAPEEPEIPEEPVYAPDVWIAPDIWTVPVQDETEEGPLDVPLYYSEDWLWPVEGVYHIVRGWSGTHRGIDISDDDIAGLPVRAAKAGVVVDSCNICPHISAYDECAGGCGNYVTIRHYDGTYSRYMHLEYGSPVRRGTVVEAGDEIGRIGSSGRSTGYHLHFEIWNRYGERVNPNPTDGRHDYFDMPNISYLYELPQPATPSLWRYYALISGNIAVPV